MKASTSCPKCASTFVVSRANEGRSAKCRKCSQSFVIRFSDLPEPSDNSPPQAIPPEIPLFTYATPTAIPVISTEVTKSRLSFAVTPLALLLASFLCLIVGYFAGFAHGNGGLSLSANAANATERFSTDQAQIANDALQALETIDAAIEIGVSYQKYTSLLADVNASVNRAERGLPPSEFVSSLVDAMDAYKHVAELWAFKIKYDNIGAKLSSSYADHAAIIAKYGGTAGLKDGADTDFAMQTLWGYSSGKLRDARKRL